LRLEPNLIKDFFEGTNASLNSVHLSVDAINLVGGFKYFAALHFRVFGGGRVGGLSGERGA
jgi:hypothetical protein